MFLLLQSCRACDDVLGNTIAIMGKGRLRAFGTSLHLKNVFGAGYQFIFTCEPGNETDVKNLIKAADPERYEAMRQEVRELRLRREEQRFAARSRNHPMLVGMGTSRTA